MPAVNSDFRFLTPKQPLPDLPLFVFLPGMDGTGELLRCQINSGLGRTFDLRCLAIPKDDLSGWDALANRVIELIRAELNAGRHKRPVYLCGESFGGCLALLVCLRSHKLIDRLILVNAASSFNQRPLLPWGSQFVSWFPAIIYPVSAVGLLPFLASLGRMKRRERQDLLQAMQSLPQATTCRRLSLLREFKVTDAQLRTVSQPVLVIASGADRLLPSVGEGQRLANCLPNAKIVVLPESGHACLLERDVDLYQILESENFIPHPLVKSPAEYARLNISVGH
ncbi:alpha/beta fold hydrolase [Kamptonema formosum]|uniref:alpha/beta fold hydrolase n=1 Tax=Kamptonema formosum TaxID=331992 RepID=UPI00034A86A5|nr:alpha/beta hydrolase [Oscillatoria sp. PCC 10802]